MNFLRRLFAIPSVLELREELESTRRELRGTKGDLGDLWERFTRLQGRLAKRGELSSTPPGENGDPASVPSSRAQTLQEQILARRGHRVSR
jgi:hypothetical protein